MFFIVSKVFSFLLIPAIWIFFILIWARFTKQPLRKKRLYITALVLAILFSNNFIYHKLVLWYQPDKIELAKNQVFTTGILLGGMSCFDDNNIGYFTESADRFIETVKLYHQKNIQKIIVTGGTPRLGKTKPPEADFIKKELLLNAVAENDIIVDNDARNTFENALNTKKIIDSLHLGNNHLLITSALHVPRASKVFKKAGITFTSFPCDFRVKKTALSVDEIIVPNLRLLHEWSYFIKELIGSAVYSITGKA